MTTLHFSSYKRLIKTRLYQIALCFGEKKTQMACSCMTSTKRYACACEVKLNKLNWINIIIVKLFFWKFTVRLNNYHN